MRNEKNTLRTAMREKLATMDPAWRAEASEALANRVMASRVWRAAKVVGLFAGRADEVDTEFFIRSGQKKMVYPKVVDGELKFCEVQSLEELQPGAWGILEPTRSRTIQPDLVLVPGLAFDAAGGRLGRGKGFYDRWQAAHPAIATLGVGFDFQLVPAVPREAHDGTMNWVVTEAGFYPETR